MSDEANKERRSPRAASLPFGQVLEIFERDRERHMLAGPSTPQDIAHVEKALGVVLPEFFRAFLLRIGSGLFYNGHEIFGPMRCMVHDIELVPDVLSVAHRLREEGKLAPGFVPLHRARGVIHLLDARHVVGGSVIPAGGGAAHPDLAAFLEVVVLPRQ